MATDTPISLTIPGEAAALIAEWGMQHEFQQMIEHARQVMPGLKKIDVEVDWGPRGDEPRILIQPWVPAPESDNNPTESAWIRWEVTTFPPHVLEHFIVLSVYEAPQDGR